MLLSFICASYLANIALPSYNSADRRDFPKCAEEELSEAASLLLARVNTLSEEADFGFSALPYGAKRSVFSSVYTALGISGLYYFPTAEYVVNTQAPQYVAIFSAAHEYAHFSSVMREDEANLYAYKLLVSSDNAFFRYSAYLYAYELIASALTLNAPERRGELFASLSDVARSDISSHREYVGKYKRTAIYRASRKLNGAAQSLYDERGGASYSSSVNLLTDYILSG